MEIKCKSFFQKKMFEFIELGFEIKAVLIIEMQNIII